MTSVLVLDDEHGIRKALSLLLKSEGYDVFEASNYSSAVQCVKDNTIDVALLDVMLGGEKTGYDVFKQIADYSPTTNCVFVTAVNASEEKRRDLVKDGAIDYISKPFENSEVVHVVKRATAQKKINDKTIVGYGHIGICKAPEKLRTVLGSCVGVTLYDKEHKVAGMTHIMLSRDGDDYDTRGARQAIEQLFRKMIRLGSTEQNIECKIYGGSSMIENEMAVGESNLKRAKEVIKEKGLRISEEDTGGKDARQITMDASTGEVQVKYFNNV